MTKIEKKERIMKNSHKWDEMLPEEFYQEHKRASIAYLPCGGIEEHGLHNPLGTDCYISYEICLRAVKISGGILFPLIPFAPAYIPGLSREELRSGKKKLYPPSLWVSKEICENLYVETIESIADIGFKACIAFSGHLPADLLLQKIASEQKECIGKMRLWGGGISIIKEIIEKRSLLSGHGMMAETSMVMATRKKLVRLPRARCIKVNLIDSQLKDKPPEMLAKIVLANRKFGEQLINRAAQHLAKIAQKMLK